MRSTKFRLTSLLVGLFVAIGLAFGPGVAEAQDDYATPNIVANPGAFTVAGTVADASFGLAGGVAPVAGAAGGDEVLGTTVEAGGGGGLALTGSDVNVPVAVGALLIGSGGLFIAAARKRDRQS